MKRRDSGVERDDELILQAAETRIIIGESGRDRGPTENAEASKTGVLTSHKRLCQATRGGFPAPQQTNHDSSKFDRICM